MSQTRWIGVCLVIVGIVLLLDALGIVAGIGWLFHWWPVLVIVLGVRLILRKPESLTSGLGVVALGCLLLADNIIPEFDFWVAAVPVMLIVIGIGIIVRPIAKERRHHTTAFVFGRREQTISNELIHVTAVFGGIEQTIVSPNFRGGSVQAIFGGVELDFRPAQMAAMEASLDIEALFGGVKIRVPPHWAVSIEGTPLFGGIDNKAITTSVTNNTPVLRIRATVVFGGVEIH
ncbi:MAG: cell wall-active antibiotics response protein [Chlorobi bacterium]|nr:cell wall-active antibiotics response protein [Chlorobiota bacterium]